MCLKVFVGLELFVDLAVSESLGVFVILDVSVCLWMSVNPGVEAAKNSDVSSVGENKGPINSFPVPRLFSESSPEMLFSCVCAGVLLSDSDIRNWRISIGSLSTSSCSSFSDSDSVMLC